LRIQPQCTSSYPGTIRLLNQSEQSDRRFFIGE
jgi:hypothetical protein